MWAMIYSNYQNHYSRLYNFDQYKFTVIARERERPKQFLAHQMILPRPTGACNDS